MAAISCAEEGVVLEEEQAAAGEAEGEAGFGDLEDDFILSVLDAEALPAGSLAEEGKGDSDSDSQGTDLVRGCACHCLMVHWLTRARGRRRTRLTTSRRGRRRRRRRARRRRAVGPAPWPPHLPWNAARARPAIWTTPSRRWL